MAIRVTKANRTDFVVKFGIEAKVVVCRSARFDDKKLAFAVPFCIKVNALPLGVNRRNGINQFWIKL